MYAEQPLPLISASEADSLLLHQERHVPDSAGGQDFTYQRLDGGHLAQVVQQLVDWIVVLWSNRILVI